MCGGFNPYRKRYRPPFPIVTITSKCLTGKHEECSNKSCECKCHKTVENLNKMEKLLRERDLL